MDPRLRFAFYGRVSTWGFQDPWSSDGWQRASAVALVGDQGVIVAEFFDVACSRRVDWPLRPKAAELLAAIADPDRGFDAIVVGESERAFYGRQLLQMAPLFERHGVQVWLPEIGGPVDFQDPVHRAVVMQLGGQSRREVLRCQFRTTAAMVAQVREQGRFQGGRPPYGYRLADAGPHPNRVHASWGRRVRRLDPDPQTAPHVVWMFGQRLEGMSLAGIAKALNEAGVLCPSGFDPERNQHRGGERWILRTVAAILENPRYTGRQVWNRQRVDRDETWGVTGGACGGRQVRRWAQPSTEQYSS